MEFNSFIYFINERKNERRMQEYGEAAKVISQSVEKSADFQYNRNSFVEMQNRMYVLFLYRGFQPWNNGRRKAI